MPKKPVDSAVYKKIISREAISHRAPHDKTPKTTKPRFNAFFTTNHVALLGDHGAETDAAWDRTNMLEMFTKYICDPALVDPEKFVFLRDFNKREELLNNASAFFSICIQRLIVYLSSLERRSDGTPIIRNFSAPESIRLRTDEIRQSMNLLGKFLLGFCTKKITSNFKEYVTVDTLFEGFGVYLFQNNEQVQRKNLTKNLFIERLAQSKIKICHNTFVEGIILLCSLLLMCYV
jgi:hypothetical protein